MILRAALLVALMGTAHVAVAASAATEAAVAAVARLDEAGLQLHAAESARDRVMALTTTVQAYEQGLVALRDGLRKAAIRQSALETELEAKSDDVARLLGVLQSIGREPTPVLMLHPSGALGTARSGMILADVTPALQAEVVAIRSRVDEVAVLRDLQEHAAERLQEGLDGAQRARAELSAAISDRTDLPRRFADDPVQMSLLVASAETLESFAGSLTQMEALNDAPLPDALDQRGSIVLPVVGRVLRGFNEEDLVGVKRPGLLIATQPRALVTMPVAATLRFKGELLDLGNVAIVEPAAGVLFVLAGLAEVFGDPGQVLPAGGALGLMGGEAPLVDELLTELDEGSARRATETLYLEVREDQTAVDPATWFAIQEE